MKEKDIKPCLGCRQDLSSEVLKGFYHLTVRPMVLIENPGINELSMQLMASFAAHPPRVLYDNNVVIEIDAGEYFLCYDCAMDTGLIIMLQQGD